jgi:hypothetical protein
MDAADAAATAAAANASAALASSTTTDPISGVEQKGGCVWRRVGLYFHEYRKFKPDNFESDLNDLSLSKRWSFIQAECNRFCGALENVKKRKLSGHGVSELVRCFLRVLISLCEVGLF